MASRISLRQLEYFVAVCRAGSIATAADAIHVSASAISAAVAHLERELAAQLFVRHHVQGLSLTSVGELVQEQAQRVLALSDQLYTVASDGNAILGGALRIGCFVTLAALFAPELIQGFARDNPQVRLTQIQDHQEALLKKLRHAELDLAVTYDMGIDGGDIAFEPLATLAPYAIVGAAHPLAGRDRVTLDELASHPVVILDLPLSGDYFLSLFKAAGLTPQIAATTTSQDVLRALVANDIGYCLANIRPKARVALDGRALVPLKLEGQHRPLKLGLAWYKGQKMSKVMHAFCERSRTLISEGRVPGMSFEHTERVP
jgi:hypothetical protein